MTETMSLVQIESALMQLTAQREEAQKQHKKYLEETGGQLDELRRQREMYMGGLDLEKVQIAENLLRVDGLRNNRFDDQCVQKAIEDILQGCQHMKTEYFGIKDYAQFIGQHSNHRYGYGPTHGNIVFSIGLKNPKEELAEDEKECCVYYLNAIKNEETRKSIVRQK